MIVPQIKPSNLCIKLGHKAYFLFASQLPYMLVHYIRQRKYKLKGELCRWLSSISLCVKSTACSQHENGIKTQVLFESVTVMLLTNHNTINVIILPPPFLKI